MLDRRHRLYQLAAILLAATILTSLLGTSLVPRTEAIHLSKPHLGVWNEQRATHNVTDTTILAGTIITWSINLTEVGEMNAFDVKLRYNSNILSPTAIDTNGNILGSPEFEFKCGAPGTEACFDEGIVNVVQVTTAGTVSGSGFLFKASFAVKDVPGGGFSQLELPSPQIQNAGQTIDLDITNGVFSNSAQSPPTVAFTFKVDCAMSTRVPCQPGQNVSIPIRGQTVLLNASDSRDPNAGGSIVFFEWDFGDGTTLTNNSTDPDYPIIRHVFCACSSMGGVDAFGNFTVTLKARNSFGLEKITSRIISVLERIFHDAVAQAVILSRTSVPVGVEVLVRVRVLNGGTLNDIIGVELYRDSYLVGRLNATVAKEDDMDFEFTLITTGLRSGIYQLTALVSILTANVVDEDLGDNTVLGFLHIQFPLQAVAGGVYLATGGFATIVVSAVAYGFVKSRRKPVE